MKATMLIASVAGFSASLVALVFGGGARFPVFFLFAIPSARCLKEYLYQRSAGKIRTSDSFRLQQAEILEVFSPRRDVSEALSALPSTYAIKRTREIGFIDGGFGRFDRIYVTGVGRFTAVIDIERQSVSNRQFHVARV
jgi:hypothetical protein